MECDPPIQLLDLLVCRFSYMRSGVIMKMVVSAAFSQHLSLVSEDEWRKSSGDVRSCWSNS